MLNNRKQIQITFKNAPQIDTVYISNAVEIVKTTILKIINDERQFDTHKSYNLIRELVLYHQDKALLEWVVVQCTDSLVMLDPTNIQHFQEYETKVKAISTVLAYMNSKQNNIYTTLLMIYRRLLTPDVFDYFMQNKSIDAIRMIHQLQATIDFNAHVMHTLEIQYSKISVPEDVPNFLNFLSLQFQQELTIANEYYPDIKSNIHQLLLNSFFIANMTLLSDQFKSLFSLNSEQKIGLFQLLKDAHRMPSFGQYLESFLIQESTKFLALENDAVVSSWMLLLHECHLMLQPDYPWIDHYKRAFSVTLNKSKNGKNCTELLVKYTDKVMRGHFDKIHTFQQISNFIILLFRCLQDKDVFIAFYKVHLARRLLLQKSANLDEEKQFVHKMKLEIGPSNTQHLEGMFTDMTASFEETTTFLGNFPNSELPCPFQFSCNILTSSRWPSYPRHNLTLPLPLNAIYEQYKAYHLQKNKMKTLTLVPLLSKCVLTCRFKQPKELVCNTLQASILLTLGGSVNENEISTTQQTFAQLKQQLGMADVDLKNTLKSLMNQKAMVIESLENVF